MRTSAAQIKANQINSARSTGPKTAEGKESSRRNGLKHGMTGQGIVVPEGEADEVELRHQALQAELAPISVMGAILVGQMASLSIRMERGAKQEFAAVAERVRHASDDFDAERLEHAQELLKAIGDDPRGNLRKLLKSPEGVNVLIEAWQDLRADLTREPGPAWSLKHGATMISLLGCREKDAEAARVESLTRATWAEFNTLAASDGEGLDRDARQAWARNQLLERIDGEIAELEAHFETLDFETIELDRAGAGARALFDPSKEASLARRYESEARRGFFKSLKEFRQAEVEEAERLVSAPPASANSPSYRMASSCEGSSTDLDAMLTESYYPVSEEFSSRNEVVRGIDGQPSRSGRAVSVPA
jgi:hypothetical protein